MKTENMNNQQRKMLDNIYSQLLNEKRIEYGVYRGKKLKELEATILLKAETKYKRIINKLNQVTAEAVKISKTIREDNLSISLTCEGKNFKFPENKIKTGISFSNMYPDKKQNKQIENFKEETELSTRKIQEMTMEIRADIYGLQVSYKNIRKELDKKIKTLKLA